MKFFETVSQTDYEWIHIVFLLNNKLDDSVCFGYTFPKPSLYPILNAIYRELALSGSNITWA